MASADVQSALKADDRTFNVLWTGGWDSTFRVLELSLHYGAVVQPYYLIDVNRRSTLRELQAISEIRKSIEEESATAADRILPTKIAHSDELPRISDISDNFHAILKTTYIGDQYVYLALLARRYELDDLELCVHQDDRAAVALAGATTTVDDGTLRGSFEIAPERMTTELALFRDFRFPLLQFTKTDMESTARDRGVLHIMEKTWFCHSPILGRYPCGVCAPCKYAIQEGMGHRVPSLGRLFNQVKKVPGTRQVYRALRRM